MSVLIPVAKNVVTAQVADLINQSQDDVTPSIPPEKPVLTNKQALCLSFIYTYRVNNERSPSEAEVAESMGVTQQTARSFLQALQKKKCIRRDRKKVRRNLIITKLGEELLTKARVIDTSGQMPLFSTGSGA